MTDLEVANTPAAVAKKSTDEQALAIALDEKAGAMVDDSGRSIGEDEVEQALTEDIYSLMSTTPIFSLGFGFGLGTFIVQSGFLFLILIDLLDLSAEPFSTNGVVNRMYIPADCHMTVTLGQFLAIGFIVNFSADGGDLFSGFGHLLSGYDPDVAITHPHATKWKWYASGVLQFFVGIVMVVDLLVLLLQSERNIGLALNFAALTFVQDIDDVAFSLASMGLINREVQKQCNCVGEITVKTRDKNRQNWMKRVFIVVLGVSLYIPFFIVAGWQWSGRFMCKSVFVQFGDTYGTDWGYYSGVFDNIGLSFEDRTEGRPAYVDSTGTIRLAYCGAQRAWTFSNITRGDGQCQYFAKSSETEGYDVMAVAGNTWFAKTPDLGDVPMDWLMVSCNDCSEDMCAGSCVDNRCVCNNERLGTNCEFEEEKICATLGLDRRSKGALASLPFASLFVRETYIRLEINDPRTREMYNRPFYIHVNDDGFVDVFIIFTGYRWMMYGVPQTDTSEITAEAFITYLKENDPVHRPLRTLENISGPALPFFFPLLFSAPVKYGTQSHDEDPINTVWYLAQLNSSEPLVGAVPDLTMEISATFLCARCGNTSQPCFNGGLCQVDRTCNCTDRATGFPSFGGFACEYAYTCFDRPCQNGGACDPIFDVCVKCDPGHYGNLCQYKKAVVFTETEVDLVGGVSYLCDNNTCLNGYCASNIEPCVCSPGFAGDNCDMSTWAASLGENAEPKDTPTSESDGLTLVLFDQDGNLTSGNITNITEASVSTTVNAVGADVFD